MRVISSLFVLLMTGCAWQAVRPPESLALADLAAKSRQSAPQVSRFTADLDVTTMGPDGRRRGLVTLAVARPSSLAYQLVGPQGGLIEAFATNGTQMQLYHANTGQFLYGPATPANLDRFLGRIPVHFSAARWVQLFFGEVDFPQTASARWDASLGRVVLEWSEQSLTNRVELEPQSLRPLRGQVVRDGRVISDVRIEQRDSAGLPQLLRLEVPDEHLSVVARLKDITQEPALEESTFVLSPPPGANAEHLDGAP